MSAFRGKADIEWTRLNVRFRPKADIGTCRAGRYFAARFGSNIVTNAEKFVSSVEGFNCQTHNGDSPRAHWHIYHLSVDKLSSPEPSA